MKKFLVVLVLLLSACAPVVVPVTPEAQPTNQPIRIEVTCQTQ